MLINPETGHLEIDTSIGLSEKTRELKLVLGKGITGWVAAHGRPARVADVKMRSFILPGQAVEIETAMRSATDGMAELTLAAMVGGKRVATGRVEIVPRGPA